eukprot:scaffold12.g8180.t1
MLHRLPAWSPHCCSELMSDIPLPADEEAALEAGRRHSSSSMSGGKRMQRGAAAEEPEDEGPEAGGEEEQGGTEQEEAEGEEAEEADEEEEEGQVEDQAEDQQVGAEDNSEEEQEEDGIEEEEAAEAQRPERPATQRKKRRRALHGAAAARHAAKQARLAVEACGKEEEEEGEEEDEAGDGAAAQPEQPAQQQKRRRLNDAQPPPPTDRPYHGITAAPPGWCAQLRVARKRLALQHQACLAAGVKNDKLCVSMPTRAAAAAAADLFMIWRSNVYGLPAEQQLLNHGWARYRDSLAHVVARLQACATIQAAQDEVQVMKKNGEIDALAGITAPGSGQRQAGRSPRSPRSQRVQRQQLQATPLRSMLTRQKCTLQHDHDEQQQQQPPVREQQQPPVRERQQQQLQGVKGVEEFAPHEPEPEAQGNAVYGQPQHRKEILGRRIRVYRPSDSRWYGGLVVKYYARLYRHTVRYDDGTEQPLDLRQERYQLLPGPAEPPAGAAAAQRRRQSTRGPATGPAPAPKRRRALAVLQPSPPTSNEDGQVEEEETVRPSWRLGRSQVEQIVRSAGNLTERQVVAFLSMFMHASDSRAVEHEMLVSLRHKPALVREWVAFVLSNSDSSGCTWTRSLAPLVLPRCGAAAVSSSDAAVDLGTACGVPLAVACAPFPPPGAVAATSDLHASDVGRCHACHAYVNRLCQFGEGGYTCALCGVWNDYTAGVANLRYASATARGALPELAGDVYDAACSLAAAEEEEEAAEVLEAPAAPVFVALVDAAGPPDFLEGVATALTAALEALPPDALFGLVLFSDKLGLCAPSPAGTAVHYVPLLRTGPAPTPVELQEALPLSALLTSVATSKAEAQQCIDSALRAAGQGEEDRCAGPALQTVLRYLAGRTTPGACRVTLFLSGPPNARQGSVVRAPAPAVDEAVEEATLDEMVGVTDFLDPSFPELSAWQAVGKRQAKRGGATSPSAVQRAVGEIDLRHAAPRGAPAAGLEVDWQAREFWEQAGNAAAALGIQGEPVPPACRLLLDVCVVCEGFVGLEDVYKRLSCAPATNCLVRLRASPELEPLRCHPASRAVPDEQHAHLFHVPAAAPDDTFLFELRRTSAPLHGTPVVQLVSQYSVVQPGEAGGSVLRRWLRVHTLPLRLATSPAELWASCSVDALAVLMVHIAVEAAEDSGTEAARRMLLDWLCVLAVATSRDGVVDASLSGVEGLGMLPRIAFGLLASPLLAPAPRSQHPDLEAFVRQLWLTLPPGELATALYPRLSSWVDADTVAGTRHSLSRAALDVSEAPLLLLDTYWQLAVVLREECEDAEGVAFPPPQHSALRSAVDGMRQARRITPVVLMVTDAEREAALVLRRALVDDADGGAFIALLKQVGQQARAVLLERS